MHSTLGEYELELLRSLAARVRLSDPVTAKAGWREPAIRVAGGALAAFMTLGFAVLLIGLGLWYLGVLVIFVGLIGSYAAVSRSVKHLYFAYIRRLPTFDYSVPNQSQVLRDVVEPIERLFSEAQASPAIMHTTFRELGLQIPLSSSEAFLREVAVPAPAGTTGRYVFIRRGDSGGYRLTLVPPSNTCLSATDATVSLAVAVAVSRTVSAVEDLARLSSDIMARCEKALDGALECMEQICDLLTILANCESMPRELRVAHDRVFNHYEQAYRACQNALNGSNDAITDELVSLVEIGTLPPAELLARAVDGIDPQVPVTLDRSVGKAESKANNLSVVVEAILRLGELSDAARTAAADTLMAVGLLGADGEIDDRVEQSRQEIQGAWPTGDAFILPDSIFQQMILDSDVVTHLTLEASDRKTATVERAISLMADVNDQLISLDANLLSRLEPDISEWPLAVRSLHMRGR